MLKQTTKTPTILAIVPALQNDLCPETLSSIRNQSIPVTKIVTFTQPEEHRPFHSKMSHVLNNGIKKHNINLSKYDYILRVDGDTTIPPDFLELNLKGKPDAVGIGSAHIIKTAPFIKYMNGKFFEHHDDNYINHLFLMKGLKVPSYAVEPIIKRKSVEHHGYKYMLNWGKIEYQEGYMPLFVLISWLNSTHKKMRLFYLIGYLKSLISLNHLFPVAAYNRNEQIQSMKKRKYHKLLSSIAQRLTHTRHQHTWTVGPTILQIGTNELCNLDCVYCNVEYLRDNQISQMSLQTFKKILKQTSKTVKKVHLFLNNDPLLEPHLDKFAEMVKWHTKAKTVVYTNGTNTIFRKHLLNIDEVHFTISAATPETYLKVHRKPYFNRALNNYHWFKKHQKKNQTCTVHFVMVAENLHEIEMWKKLFSDSSQNVSALHDGYRQYASKECLKHVNNKENLKKSTLKGNISPTLPCTVWDNLSISPDGTILQCCDSPYSVNYGNVKNTKIKDAWQRRIKNMMNNPACKECVLKRRDWKAILQRNLNND